MPALKLEQYFDYSYEFVTNPVADVRTAKLPVPETSPARDPIDYAKMRKDIKVRFSKTLAYLAK